VARQPPARAELYFLSREQQLIRAWARWARARQLWLQLGALGRALHARRAVAHAWAAWVARRSRRPPLAAHVEAHLAARRAVACLRAGGVMRGWRKLRAAGRQWARLRRAVRAALYRDELRALRTWAAEAAARRLRRHVLTVWLGGVRPEHTSPSPLALHPRPSPSPSPSPQAGEPLVSARAVRPSEVA
jgi:hypothetical protein